MKRLLLLSFFLTTFPICKCQTEENNYFSIGLNFPTFIGKSLELKSVYAYNPIYNWTITTGIMFNNGYAAKFGLPYNGTDDHINSGIYIGIGSRLTPRKSLLSNYPFLGGKIYSGYFKQSATYDSQIFIFSDDFYYFNDRVYSEGMYIGIAGEIGYAFMIKRRLNIEIGFEYGQELYSSDHIISNFYSRLPGMGIFHTKGLLTLYYKFK